MTYISYIGTHIAVGWALSSPRVKIVLLIANTDAPPPRSHQLLVAPHWGLGLLSSIPLHARMSGAGVGERCSSCASLMETTAALNHECSSLPCPAQQWYQPALFLMFSGHLANSLREVFYSWHWSFYLASGMSVIPYVCRVRVNISH